MKQRPQKMIVPIKDCLDKDMVDVSTDLSNNKPRKKVVDKNNESKFEENRFHRKHIAPESHAFDYTPIDNTQIKRQLKPLNGEPSEWYKKHNKKGQLDLYGEGYNAQKKVILKGRKDNYYDLINAIESNSENKEKPKVAIHSYEILRKKQEPCLKPQQVKKEDLIQSIRSNYCIKQDVN